MKTNELLGELKQLYQKGVENGNVEYHICTVEKNKLYIVLKGKKEAISQYKKYRSRGNLLDIDSLVDWCKFRNVKVCALTEDKIKLRDFMIHFEVKDLNRKFKKNNILFKREMFDIFAHLGLDDDFFSTFPASELAEMLEFMKENEYEIFNG